MTIAADSPPVDHARRRISRIERQARIGILRNTNDPPRPPTRRAMLTGRWLSLRSSRRPVAPLVPEAPPEPAPAKAPRLEQAIRRAPDGQVQGIDVQGLMAAVDGLGTNRPIRTPYAALMRPDGPEPPAPAPKKPPILTPDAWVEDDPDPLPLQPPPRAPAPARSAGISGPLLGGLVVALVILVLVPAAFGL